MIKMFCYLMIFYYWVTSIFSFEMLQLILKFWCWWTPSSTWSLKKQGAFYQVSVRYLTSETYHGWNIRHFCEKNSDFSVSGHRGVQLKPVLSSLTFTVFVFCEAPCFSIAAGELSPWVSWSHSGQRLHLHFLFFVQRLFFFHCSRGSN